MRLRPASGWMSLGAPSGETIRLPGEAPAAAGRRAANKLDKLNRIKAAARELFVSRGYDEATVREIAAQAGVGLGTLFTYSRNKRDLLFLVGNDSLDSVATRAGE